MIQNNFYFLLILIIINSLFIFYLDPISKKIGLFDKPDFKRKIHKKPMPLIGGIIIITNLLITLIYIFSFSGFDLFIKILYIDSIKSFIVFFSILLFVFLIGLFDDKFTLSPIKKLLTLVFIFYVICVNDHTTLIDNLKFPLNNLQVNFSQLSLIFSISCYVFLIIALNMFDGINLQSSIFYITNFVFLIISWGSSNLILYSILLGLLAFSYLNYKNKSFLGDNGVFILSFILGYFYVKVYNFTSLYQSTDIFIFLFLPAIDSFRVIIERQLKNKPVFLPDKLHFHHILLNKYKYKKTLLIISIFIVSPHLAYIFKLNSFYFSLILTFSYFYLLKLARS